MKVVLTIFVMHSEILACMMYGRTGPPLKLVAVQEGEQGCLQVVAITNANIKGKDLENNYMLAKPSTSMWDSFASREAHITIG